MTEKPFISIITPCINRVGMIRPAIESVVAQNFPDLEHIVVDGGSSDGTLELLKTEYPHLNVTSGPDRGMYDALNKGLELANGEVIGFLNSDDLYAENAFALVAEQFREQNTLAVAGEALIFTVSPDGETNIASHFSPESASLLELSTIGSPYFNAWFFRRSVFEKIGNFDINYRIAADREFMLRFALSGLKYTLVHQLICQYRQHADSMTFDVTDLKLERILDEQIAMTGAYLEKCSLPTEARDLLRRLRTHDTMEMAVRSLKKMDFHKAAHYSRQGIKHDPLWFPKFIRRVIH